MLTLGQLGGLFACLMLGACLSNTTELQIDPAQEAITLLVELTDGYQIFTYHPDAGLKPWGPPLTDVEPGPTTIASARAAPKFDRATVTIVVDSQALFREYRSYFGDGRSWRRLDSGHSHQVQSSPNLELVWISEELRDNRWSERLWRPGGGEWYSTQGEPTEFRLIWARPQPRDGADRLAFFYDRDNICVFEGPGECRRIADRPGTLPFVNSQSIVVDRRDEPWVWIDLQGQSIQNDAFHGEPDSISRYGFQLSQGRISRISGLEIVDYGPAPEGLYIANDLRPAGPQTILVSAGEFAEIRNSDGWSARFEAPALDRIKLGIEAETEVRTEVWAAQATRTTEGRWLVGVWVRRWTPNDRRSQILERTLHLWRPESDEWLRVEIEGSTGNTTLRSFGYCWEDGALHCVSPEGRPWHVETPGRVLSFH